MGEDKAVLQVSLNGMTTDWSVLPSKLQDDIRASIEKSFTEQYFGTFEPNVYITTNVKTPAYSGHKLDWDDVVNNIKDSMRRLDLGVGYGKSRMGSKGQGDIIPMYNPGSETVEYVSSLNASDLEKIGYIRMKESACDACGGMGEIKGELCWHCEGDHFDPTKPDPRARR